MYVRRRDLGLCELKGDERSSFAEVEQAGSEDLMRSKTESARRLAGSICWSACNASVSSAMDSRRSSSSLVAPPVSVPAKKRQTFVEAVHLVPFASGLAERRAVGASAQVGGIAGPPRYFAHLPKVTSRSPGAPHTIRHSSASQVRPGHENALWALNSILILTRRGPSSDSPGPRVCVVPT